MIKVVRQPASEGPPYENCCFCDRLTPLLDRPNG